MARSIAAEAKPFQFLGYSQLREHLEGNLSRENAVQQIQQATRQFAKRQITWFRHLVGCQPVPAELTEVLARVTITP